MVGLLMKQFGLPAFFIALGSILAVGNVFAAENSGRVYLEVLRSPPNRHVIAMDNMADCLRAAEHTKSKCVTRQPRLPDTSTGTFRSLNWTPDPVAGVTLTAPTAILKGKDFGPVYLVVRQSPPNRHVITMASMKKCLEAAAFTSAKCLKKLPTLPDASTGVFRTLRN